MVVRSGSDYYVSEASIGLSGSSVLTITDPNAQNWLLFDPTATNFGNIDGSNITGSLVSGGLGTIDAVGFFFEGEARAIAGNGTDNWQFDNFVVTATTATIPEPSTFGLIRWFPSLWFDCSPTPQVNAIEFNKFSRPDSTHESGLFCALNL